jgi:CheY-like chemotaxis protein
MPVPCVLIVDDQRDIVRLLHATMDTLGHDLNVIEAPSGEEALLEASHRKIDLLIADYRLPGISGLELVKKINVLNPDIKVILITGMADKKVRDEIIAAGAFAFFDKPIPLADFLDAVERCLDLTRTIFPPEDGSTDPTQHKTLSELLTGYRKELGAEAIILLSDRGRVLVRAGAFHDSSMEVSLLSTLIAIFNISQKVARIVHQEIPSNLHIYEGGDQDLIMLPVDAAHALVIAGEKIAQPARIIEKMDALRTLQDGIIKVLRSIGVTPSQLDIITPTIYPQAEDAVEPEAGADELENLLTRATKKKLKSDEADSFWDTALDKLNVVQTDPDRLSYEQARQLGLTPDEEDK